MNTHKLKHIQLHTGVHVCMHDSYTRVHTHKHTHTSTQTRTHIHSIHTHMYTYNIFTHTVDWESIH